MTKQTENDNLQHHTYHRTQLVKMVQQDTGVKKNTVELVMNSIFNTIKQLLINGDSITIVNFGKWYTKVHHEKRAFLPYTNTEYIISSIRRPLFHASATLKNQIQEYDDYFDNIQDSKDLSSKSKLDDVSSINQSHDKE